MFINGSLSPITFINDYVLQNGVLGTGLILFLDEYLYLLYCTEDILELFLLFKEFDIGLFNDESW